ncbi:MAG: hypothetical protein IID45_12700, partial [Planctomycetes bacterium]|nr:hypothetical protein [Planctomycetota bacterium]
MDLPSCPSCGQSVLDDDVEECPFCGSSMSETPTAAAISPQKKAESRAVAEPVKTKSPSQPRTSLVGKKTAGKPVDSGNDDPFAVDPTAKTKAIPLHRKPEKGRRHAVKCPMCEITGYTARKAAGQDVRCSNPDCLVPIFTAPALESDDDSAAEEPTAPKPFFLTAAGIGVIAASVALTGLGVWFVGFRG